MGITIRIALFKINLNSKILNEKSITRFLYMPFKRYSSLTNSEVCKKRIEIFSKEKQRQQALITRVEKIEVHYTGIPEECRLLMNKNLSTPFQCTLHMHEMLQRRSVLALMNNKPWDMNRPLEEDCDLDFLHFKAKNTFEVNKAFWRSCSFMLGMLIEKAFQIDIFVELHSWPKPNIRSGSFVYDADLKIANWEPKEEEMRVFTVMLRKLSTEDLQFERLEIPLSVAMKMFEDNRFKTKQLPKIAQHSENGDSVIVYRLGDHIDISHGPMISNTNQIGNCQLTAINKIQTEDGPLYRFQGIALPLQLPLNNFAFNILVERAKKLNTNGLPLMSEKIAA